MEEQAVVPQKKKKLELEEIIQQANQATDAGIPAATIVPTLVANFKDFLKEEKDQIHSDTKRIISHNFGKERNKKRIMDETKNQELMNHLGSVFTVIESEVKDDLRQYLVDGKDIFSIVPKIDFEKDEE